MSDRTSTPTAAFGFLSFVESTDGSVAGGLLVLNAAGRPLEFHCTAPVRPNRAQEILYGPTLRPYLYGEQIAATLLAKAKANLHLALVDAPAALAVRPLVELPVVCLADEARAPGPDDLPARLGDSTAIVHRRFASDAGAVADSIAAHLSGFDLREPFGRIHEALAEAAKAA